MLAVLYQGLEYTLEASGAYRGTIHGKTLVDCCNPVETKLFTLVPYVEGSLAQHVATRTGAWVAKAFNLAQADIWRRPPTYGGRPLVVPIAGHEPARDAARLMVSAVGAASVDVGGIEHAAYLEATAALVIARLWGGDEASTTFQLTTADDRLSADADHRLSTPR